jgi:hypothetical protein
MTLTRLDRLRVKRGRPMRISLHEVSWSRKASRNSAEMFPRVVCLGIHSRVAKSYLGHLDDTSQCGDAPEAKPGEAGAIFGI